MKLLKYVVLILLVLLGIGYAGSQWLLHERMPQSATIERVDIRDARLIERGKYIARTADCIACHSAPGGKPFAGGLAMDTPLGRIYSTNITPDQLTGIGSYTFERFDNAVRYGVNAAGTPLYPAMPYPSYIIMPKNDIKALYAYFMSEVTSVRQQNIPSTIPWPMSLRWPVAWWQALFAPERQFVSQAPQDQRLTRGQYLAEGPGHCGACHTPRGLFFQEKALSLAEGDSYLSGAVIDGWRAKSLRGEARGLQAWSQEALVQFFKTGRNDFAAAFGAMAEVVQHSTRHFSDDDIQALSTYLKHLPPVANKLQRFPDKADVTTATLLTQNNPGSLGAMIYMQYCVTCHRADGKGVPRIFPALAGNSAIYAHNAQSVIQIIMEGGRMPQTSFDRMSFAMPGFAHLSDEQLVAVTNFIRNGWENQAPDIQLRDIERMRAFLAGKTADNVASPREPATPKRYRVTDKDGHALPVYMISDDQTILKEPNAEQILYGKRLLNETNRLLPNYVKSQMACNSCHIAQGKVPLGAPFINTYNAFPQRNPRAGRTFSLADRINGCMQRSMNGLPLPEEGAEMKAMIAYMKWLSQNLPQGAKVDMRNSGSIDMTLKPDAMRGGDIYHQFCASCHGDNGEGKRDAAGNIAFPPLWGDESFNIGAGMARTYKAAAFVKYNMPMGVHTEGLWGAGGVLTDQQAVDVAEYFTHQPRPDFGGKVNDWPNGKKPKDARY